MIPTKVVSHSLFSDLDIYLFRSGKHYRLYEKMGSHLMNVNGEYGCYFAVYAPMAEKLCVVGDFNHWRGDEHVLLPRWDGSGIWEGFIPGVKKGDVYKYKIFPYNFGRLRMKADPFAIKAEKPPLSGSIVWDMHHDWQDQKWMQRRPEKNALNQPHSVYELHFGSWMRHMDDGRSLTYLEMADKLVHYIQEMGYTHVEFMPIAEHPYEPSWGYQVTGFFAASSRFGHPEELMYLMDQLHNADIGVIMDWVPAHFPSDDFALATFDGSCVYEHPDRRKGFHPDWNTLIFNFERNEIRSFLISNAFFWLDRFHFDGLRVDAVSSIVFLDYSRKEGEWEPNKYGGRENLDAISFLQEFNEAVYSNFPGVQTIAEESTDYPMVSRPVYQGGLGFGMKWMMGWMHDTLNYFKREFVYRKFHQNDITFSIMYAFSENFMLALSHDEVVHGKSSLIGKMSGDEWQKFANLRAMYGYMFTHPGTKLLFMGNDVAPYSEWNFKAEVPWELLEYESHRGINNTIKALNKLYRNERALYHFNFSYEGFEWLDAGDRVNSILAYFRKSDKADEKLLIVNNLNINPQKDYKFGLSVKESYTLVFNSDEKLYWGSGYEIRKKLNAVKKPWHGKAYMLELDIPPLCTLVFRIIPETRKKKDTTSVVKKKPATSSGTKTVKVKAEKRTKS